MCCHLVLKIDSDFPLEITGYSTENVTDVQQSPMRRFFFGVSASVVKSEVSINHRHLMTNLHLAAYGLIPRFEIMKC
jgi:hypothetical protein